MPASQKRLNSALSRIWHTSCNVICIGGLAAKRNWRELNVTTFSNYAQQAFAAIGALAISALLFANTLATQAAEVQSVAGILA
jgi:hypothetical protein